LYRAKLALTKATDQKDDIPGCYPVEAAVSAAGDTPVTTETEFAARTRAGNESVPRHSELREKK
jgi:hypothetical protein